jgi:ABC-type multidrug transport system fused ATPase/permease subunit
MQVDGVGLNAENLKSWQKNFGYIPQQIMLYEGSVKDNIMASSVNQSVSDAKIWKALNIASLDAFVQDLPKQLDQPIGENGVRLSGGQRQRIGIARAMLNDPNILVMDEATAALDNQTEREVTRAINKASEGRTVITIAHRLSTIENYDVIYVMKEGRVVSEGAYESLLETCEVFRKMALNVEEKV